MRAEEYAGHFQHQKILKQTTLCQFDRNLSHLYSEVLMMLWRAQGFYDKSTFGRYISAGFKPFDKTFGVYLGRIKRLENAVRDDVLLLHGELKIINEEVENGKWLRPADFSADFQKLNDARIPNTCGWILNNESVDLWIHSDNTNALYIHGKPGCGKSTLAAWLRQYILKSYFDEQQVIGVLCKIDHEGKSDLISVLRNMIHELLRKSPDAKQMHSLIQVARVESKTPFANSMEMLWELLPKLLGVLSTRFYCIIDGIDECKDDWEDVVKFLGKLARVSKSMFKVLFFSRNQPPVFDEPDISWNVYAIDSADVKDDIRQFAETKVGSSNRLRNHKHKDRVKEFLVSNADGMILWANLMFTEIESGHYNVDAAMKRPPTGLDTLYLGIVRRIAYRMESLEKCKNGLMIALACPGLNIEEFALLLALSEGLQSLEDYDQNCDPDRDCSEILELLSPLLTILPNRTIQVFHASVKSFLLNSPALKRSKELSEFQYSTTDLNESISMALLKYLQFDCFNCDPASITIPNLASRYPLLEYATFAVTRHISECVPAPPELVDAVVYFLGTRQAWRWLERLQHYGYGPEYQQMLQVRLNAWVAKQSPEFQSSWKEANLNRLIITLARRRLDDVQAETTSSEAPDSEASLRAMAALARAYWVEGMWDESAKLEEIVAEKRKQLLGLEHEDTLQALSNLASTFCTQCRWKEAEDLAKLVVEKRTKIHGDSDLSTLSSITVLALAYRAQGRIDDALPLALRVLETRRKILGPQHPSTLAAMGIVALIYRADNRWPEAEELAVQIVGSTSRNLGQNHPNTISALNSLSSIYYNQGRLQESQELAQQAVETAIKVLGEAHPTTLAAMNNLSTIHSALGHWDENLAVKTAEISKSVLGPDHPNTLITLNNLVVAFWTANRLEAAETLGREVLETRRRVVGEDHVDYLVTKLNVALVLASQGLLGEAVEWMGEVVEKCKVILGDEHPNTLAAMNALAGVLWEKGDKGEARKMADEVLEGRKRALGGKHPATKEAEERVREWRKARVEC
ncbi:TPR-like protein [Ascodesmis nigricans]|uniref:TPR-like protein n=1 Tax=Ascodesmis nigricans TaxID=341454 RepID=A0A4S2N0R6_9PEZI|nr:TPR-like protein [Ascodesmis nigricans]